MTIVAIQSGKFNKFIINDIDWRPIKCLENSIKGLYNNIIDWFFKEDFKKRKNTDEWVAVVYSFGNDLQSYNWKQEREQWSKALHYSIFYDDFSLMDYYGIDYRKLKDIKGYDNKRRYFMTEICYKYYKSGLLNKKESHFNFNFNKFNLGSNIEQFQSLLRMKKLWNLNQYQKYLSKITFLNQDYQAVEIPDHSTIYCDIPYSSKIKYYDRKFNYNEFYDWCRKTNKNIYISEYSMPQDFMPIYSKDVKQLMNNGPKTKKATEKLFICRGESN